MSTALFAITNSTLSKEEALQKGQHYLQQLQKLGMPPCHHIDPKTGEKIPDPTKWEAYIPSDPLEIALLEIDTPTSYSLTLYESAASIYTIYRYATLYKLKELDFKESFRKDLFNIISIIGGTEVIFLADNSCDKLDLYYSLIYDEGYSYEELKSKMLNELGTPVTDYELLDYDHLDYKNITEFFLDDFSDLRTP